VALPLVRHALRLFRFIGKQKTAARQDQHRQEGWFLAHCAILIAIVFNPQLSA